MVNPWFCKIDDEELGPFSGSTLKEMADSGRLARESLVRRGDSARWVKAEQVQGLFTAADSSAAGRKKSDSSRLRRAKSLDEPTARPPVPPPVAAPPPAAAGDSQPLPIGVPVGVAISPGELPVGQPVASEVARSAATAHGEHANSLEIRRRKKRQQQLLLVGGAVAAMLLLVTGTVIVMLQGGDTPVDLAAVPDDDLPPGEPLAATSTAAAASVAEPEEENAVDALLASVDRDDWREISSRRTIQLRGVFQLKVGAAWISDEPTGRRSLAPDTLLAAAGTAADETASADLPRAEDDAPKSADSAESDSDDGEGGDDLLNLLGQASAPATGKNAETGSADAQLTPAAETAPLPKQFVIVQLELTNNSDDEPLTYTSWNPIGGELAAASLVVDDRRELRGIPIAQAPGPGRFGKRLLAPGETITDHLVFEAPRGPVSSLKLILPQAAFGREGNLGFLVTREVLAEGHRERLVETAPAEQPAAPAVAGQPASGGQQAAVGAVEPQAAAEPKPLTDDERVRRDREALLRSFDVEPEEKTPPAANAEPPQDEPPQDEPAPPTK